MVRRICVALDGSAHARAAGEAALGLAAANDALLTAVHVTEGAGGGARGRRLAALLPAGFAPQPGAASGAALAEASTVTGWLAQAGAAAKVRVEEKLLEGRPAEAIEREVLEGRHDLVVIGALGEGTQDGTLPSSPSIGSTCDRLVRTLREDVYVVRDAQATAQDGPLLVALDGSPQSFAGLMTALELGGRLGRRVEAVAVYDPYLHYTLFNGIVGILSEKASKVFKFKDQEKLHEEIIDTGLAKIYQAHLEVARSLAREKGVEIGVTLLDGKASQKVLRHAKDIQPSLILLGRIGVHSGDEMDVGGATETLLRQATANLLVTSRKHVPPIELQEAESVQWVPEAVEKMDRVPAFVRGVARTAVVRWAIERGHSIITPSVINGCMGEILPPSASQAMGYVAEELAIRADKMAVGKTFICRDCGHASRDYRPVTCPVCKAGSETFEAIDREAIQAAGRLDKGAIEEEETFDGRKLHWTPEAMAVIRRVPNGYERRRSKARVEKTAKVRGHEVITEEFALDMVQQEVAEGAYLSERGERLAVELARSEQPDDETPRAREESSFTWTDSAWKRMCRVPQGFMRDMTRERVEQFATQDGAASINLELCEKGIAEGRRMMAEMIGKYDGGSKPAIPAPPTSAPDAPPAG